MTMMTIQCLCIAASVVVIVVVVIILRVDGNHRTYYIIQI